MLKKVEGALFTEKDGWRDGDLVLCTGTTTYPDGIRLNRKYCLRKTALSGGVLRVVNDRRLPISGLNSEFVKVRKQ